MEALQFYFKKKTHKNSHRRCPIKKILVNISPQYSQENTNTCVVVPVNLAKVLRRPALKNCERLLLDSGKSVFKSAFMKFLEQSFCKINCTKFSATWVF